MELILPIAITGLSAVLANVVAAEKGLNTKLWVVLALIFGLLVLPFLFFARGNPQRNTNKEKIGFMKA